MSFVAVAATVAVAAIAGAGVVKAGAQVREGEDIQRAEEFNSQIALQQSATERERGRIEVLKQRKQARLLRGEQIAGFAKAGVTLSGSPLTVIQESATNQEFDIAITQFNSEIRARRFQSEAQRRIEAGEAAKRRGRTRAGITLLETGADIALLTIGAGKGATKVGGGGTGKAIRSVRGAESAATRRSIESAFR